jgi:hypothetical protein
VISYQVPFPVDISTNCTLLCIRVMKLEHCDGSGRHTAWKGAMSHQIISVGELPGKGLF